MKTSLHQQVTTMPPLQKTQPDTIYRIPVELTEAGRAKIDVLAADVAKILTTGLLVILEEDLKLYDAMRSDDQPTRFSGYMKSKPIHDLGDVLVPTYYRNEEERIGEMPQSLTREANTPNWNKINNTRPTWTDDTFDPF